MVRNQTPSVLVVQKTTPSILSMVQMQKTSHRYFGANHLGEGNWEIGSQLSILRGPTFDRGDWITILSVVQKWLDYVAKDREEMELQECRHFSTLSRQWIESKGLILRFGSYGISISDWQYVGSPIANGPSFVGKQIGPSKRGLCILKDKRTPCLESWASIASSTM